MLRWWISGLRFGERRRHVAAARPARCTRLSALRSVSCVVRDCLPIAFRYGAALRRRHVAARGASNAGPVGTSASAMSLCLYVVDRARRLDDLSGVVTAAMWRLGVQSADVDRRAALDSVRATGAASSALGEGPGRCARRRRHLGDDAITATARRRPRRQRPRDLFRRHLQRAARRHCRSRRDRDCTIIASDRRLLDEWLYAELRRQSAPDGVLRLGRERRDAAGAP